MNERSVQTRPFLQVPRDVIESLVFQDEHLFRLLFWLQEKAAFCDGPISVYQGSRRSVVELKRGQAIVGRHSGSNALGWPPSTFRDKLARLEKLEVLSVDTPDDKKFSVVTLHDYWGYATSNDSARQPKKSKARQEANATRASVFPSESNSTKPPDDNGTTTRRQRDDTYKKGNKGDKSKPPPPSSSIDAKWLEVEEELKSCGVANWQGIEHRAVVSAEKALEEVRTYREQVGSWKPGGLLHAITKGVWPPADQAARKRFKEAAELRQRVQTQGAERGANTELIAATVARVLHEKKFGEFITSEEREAWEAMKQRAKQQTVA